MILLCTSPRDPTATLVRTRLDELGSPYRWLDLDRYPQGYRLRLRWHGTGLEGDISCDDWQLELGEISSVYVRWPAEAELDPARIEANTALSLLLDQLPALVVNRPRLGLSNHSKPYQASLIVATGLLTPPTLVTNDPAAAAAFVAAQEGGAIYKSLSSVRSIVRRVEAAQLDRLPLLARSPSQFQQLIAGDNVRVHVVGEQVIATYIATPSVDYRYAEHAGNVVTMQPHELPADVATACLRLAATLELPLVGIDLLHTVDGQYYCFEANPMPAFAYFEHYGGQPISRALAELLQHGTLAGRGVLMLAPTICRAAAASQFQRMLLAYQLKEKLAMDNNDQNNGEGQNQRDDNQPYVNADDRPEVNDTGDSPVPDQMGAGDGGTNENPQPDKASKDMASGVNHESRYLSNQETLSTLVAGLYGKLAEVGGAVEGLLNPARPNLQRN